MDERIRIPVTLPRENPTTPFWQDPPDAEMADIQSARLPDAVDVVIVGSGITGASVAWHLLGGEQPDSSEKPSILMLEARQASSGATGRNGGHTKAASYRSFLDHAATHGTETAVQIARLELACLRAVHRLAATLSIACDSRPCDTVDVIYDAGQWALALKAVAAMQAAMPADDPAAAYTLYHSREEALAAGIPCHDDDEGWMAPEADRKDKRDKNGDAVRPARIQGIIRYEAGSISAYRFVVGVLRACRQRGLGLETHTSALSVKPVEARPGSQYRWAVETARGTVLARDVVLATNGYTAFLEPQLQGVVVPLRGQIAMHTPGPERDGTDSQKQDRSQDRSHEKIKDVARHLGTTYSFIYDNGFEYMITWPPGSTCADDMVIGGGLRHADRRGAEAPGLCEHGTVDDTTLNPTVSSYLEATPRRYFGRDSCWGESSVRTAWTGIMGFTADGQPLVGEMVEAQPGDEPGDKKERVKRGLWLCCAFQGHGMVFSWRCGEALADMVQGRDDEQLQSWFPESFRVSVDRLQKQFLGVLRPKQKEEDS